MYFLKNFKIKLFSLQNSKFSKIFKKSSQNDPVQKTYARWKYHFHHHQVLVRTRNEPSIHEEDVEPAVNRQPGFRRELVEQIALFYNSILKFPSHGALQVKISISVSVSLHIFMKIRKNCYFCKLC